MSHILRQRCSAAMLTGVPPFSSLSDAELCSTLESTQHRIYPRRSWILRAGDTSDGLYVVLSGSARLLIHGAKGRELIVCDVGPHAFFGEAGLMDGRALGVSVQCHGTCELLYIPKQTALRLVQSNTAVATMLLRAVIERLSDAHEKMGNLGLVDVYGRVARVLLDHGALEQGRCVVGVGVQQIAAMIGASREMVTRVTREMINAGAVERSGRKLIVVDSELVLNRVFEAGSVARVTASEMLAARPRHRPTYQRAAAPINPRVSPRS
jgi:CRP/FNR family cyclic AMP-dependent transcriptional regulator